MRYLQKLYSDCGATPIDISRRSDSEMKQVVTAMAGVVNGRYWLQVKDPPVVVRLQMQTTNTLKSTGIFCSGVRKNG